MSRTISMLVHGPFPVGEGRAAREARAAAAAGYQVDVICMRRPGEPAIERFDGIEVHRLPLEHQRGIGLGAIAREYVGFTALAAAKLIVLGRRRRYRVVQVHNPPDFLLLAALPAKLVFGARLLFDVHDLAPDMFAARFEGGRAALVAKLVLPLCERLALLLADAVITVHEPYARELRARGAGGRVSVVMNSVDPCVLPTAQGQDGPEPGFRVVYHGTVTPWYGVDLVVDAAREVASEMPDLVVDVYGEGDALPALRERTRSLGLDGTVRFHEQWLPQTEVLSLVRSASVGVIPNRPSRLNRFALSSKLLEYVELGLPVAVAALPTLREHFADDEVLFFTPGDPAALARALLTIARDPAAARARAEAARRRARGYAWDENAARYVRLLDRLSAARRRPLRRCSSTALLEFRRRIRRVRRPWHGVGLRAASGRRQRLNRIGSIGAESALSDGRTDIRHRRLADGVPGLRELALDAFTELYAAQPDQTAWVEEVLGYLDQLIDLEKRKRIVIVGCGPRPEPLRLLREKGFDVIGVEPVRDFVDAARRHVRDEAAVLEGCAEHLPNPDASQDVVVLESVLEHVESVGKSLAEAYRVLAPGGVAYITTTNRLQLRPNQEFNVRLFQWLPDLLKESYVFHHLHHDPSLANGTERPAVHWFTYSELCRLGREAGFFKFYSRLDVKPPRPASFSGGARVRRAKAKALSRVQTRPLLRALALTQRGGMIFMVKRG